MKIVLFYHSLISDWNNGNAHFLRGIVRELTDKGHDVKVYEPENNGSLLNLIRDHGKNILKEFYSYYPTLSTNFYDPDKVDLTKIVSDADAVIVHERNDHLLVNKIGQIKEKLGFTLLFHDTHHRAATDKNSMAKYDLSNYDGVLAFGNVIRDIYLKEKWTKKAWTWHEAADVSLFHPIDNQKEGDLVWIGNWGDDERTEELMEYLITPVKELRLKAKVYGVKYSKHALKALADAGIEYGGWLPNYKVPEVFSKYKFTIHVPRRPYMQALSGIPTIRPFEALACGIPLICAPWSDQENLFNPGRDFLMAKDGYEMKHYMLEMMNSTLSEVISMHGHKAIKTKHTCRHRVDQLENILLEAGGEINEIAKEQEVLE